jgi:hypothetical protein
LTRHFTHEEFPGQSLVVLSTYIHVAMAELSGSRTSEGRDHVRLIPNAGRHVHRADVADRYPSERSQSLERQKRVHESAGDLFCGDNRAWAPPFFFINDRTNGLVGVSFRINEERSRKCIQNRAMKRVYRSLG